MKLRNITIENFRCFKLFEINFGSKTTVLIGKNGTGKTALLTAIKKSLSFIFAKDTSLGGKSLSASAPTLNISSFLKEDAHFDYSENDYQYPINLKCNAIFLDQTLYWELRRNTAGGKLYSSLYKDSYLQFMNLYNKQKKLPVLAYFSDSYPHIQTNISQYAKSILKSARPTPKNFGYYQWDSETSCAEIWERKFINSWKQWEYHKSSISLSIERIKNLIPLTDFNPLKDITPENIKKLIESGEILDNYLKKNNLDIKVINENIDIIKKRNEEINQIKNEIIFITNCLKKFANQISSLNSELELFDITVTNRDKVEYILFEFKNGHKAIFNQLPAGFKRLFSIVLDISYRAYILNRENQDDIRGVVIIDEIDLHLHPSLEQEVLERFRITFPNIQFIITTHSPLVISNFCMDDDNITLKMSVEDGVTTNKTLPNVYGIDYNTSVSDIMETPASNIIIKSLVDSYIRLMLRDKNDNADKVYKELSLILKGNTTFIDKEIKDRLSKDI